MLGKHFPEHTRGKLEKAGKFTHQMNATEQGDMHLSAVISEINLADLGWTIRKACYRAACHRRPCAVTASKSIG